LDAWTFCGWKAISCVLRAKSGSDLTSLLFILAVWEEGEDHTEPTSVLGGGMQPPQDSKALIDGPKISRLCIGHFENKKRKRLIPVIFGYLPHKLYYQMLLCTK
jgi:hypothetical protein